VLFKDNRSSTGGRAASRLTIHAGLEDADTRWPGCFKSRACLNVERQEELATATFRNIATCLSH